MRKLVFLENGFVFFMFGADFLNKFYGIKLQYFLCAYRKPSGERKKTRFITHQKSGKETAEIG